MDQNELLQFLLEGRCLGCGQVSPDHSASCTYDPRQLMLPFVYTPDKEQDPA